MAQELEGSRNMIVQEPGWFKKKTWLKNKDGSRTTYGGAKEGCFHFQQTAGDLETQCNQGQAKCKFKVNGFAQLDTSDGKPMTKSLIDTIDGPCRRRKLRLQTKSPRSCANRFHQRVPTKIAYRCKPLRPALPPWHLWTILLTRPIMSSSE